MVKPLSGGDARASTWPHNAVFGNWPTAADADWPDADWVRDMQGDRMLTSAGNPGNLGVVSTGQQRATAAR